MSGLKDSSNIKNSPILAVNSNLRKEFEGIQSYRLSCARVRDEQRHTRLYNFHNFFARMGDLSVLPAKRFASKRQDVWYLTHEMQ